MKAAQHVDRVSHGFRGKEARPEHAVAQSGNFAVFVDGMQSAPAQPGDFQAHGVRTYINGSKYWHEATRSSSMSSQAASKVLLTKRSSDAIKKMCALFNFASEKEPSLDHSERMAPLCQLDPSASDRTVLSYFRHHRSDAFNIPVIDFW
jgi:hypothetical protein